MSYYSLRLFGWTLYAHNNRPYFSERNGFIKVRRIFGWAIGVYKARKPNE